MEYPGSTLTKRRRQLLLALFLGLFLIITPLLVLYTVGYRYDWQSGLIKEIGALSIDVLPQDATVFLNGEEINEKIPVRLKNVAPSSYNLRIERSGYYDWQQEITVKSKQTIYIKDVTLIKKAEPILLTEDAATLLSTSPDGNYLIYSKKTTPDLVLKNTLSQEETILTGLSYTTSTAVSWSKNNVFFSIHTTLAPYTQLIVVKTANPEKKWDLAALEKSPINKFLWDSENDHTLYYSTTAQIRAADTNLEETTTLTTNTYLDWYFNGGQLWTMNLTTSTNEITIKRDTLGFINTFATITSQSLEETTRTNLRLRLIQNNTVLISEEQGSRMLLVNPTRSFVVPTENFTASASGWWLLWNPWELWSSLGGSDPYLLNRSGIALRQAVFIDEYNTVALRADNKISVLFPYYLVTQDILSNSQLTGLGADSENRLLYFSGAVSGKEGLWRMEY